jgi:hypothetical protein
MAADAIAAQEEVLIRSPEDNLYAERSPDEPLTQGEVSIADRSGQFLQRYIRVTNQYITIHSLAGNPPLERINFQDIKSIIYCEGLSRSAQAYARPGTSVGSEEAEAIASEIKSEPLTDFIISTTEDGYYRGRFTPKYDTVEGCHTFDSVM